MITSRPFRFVQNKKCIKNESINSHLKSQALLMSCETVVFFFNTKSSAGGYYLFSCGWCILLLFLSTLIAGQKKICGYKYECGDRRWREEMTKNENFVIELCWWRDRNKAPLSFGFYGLVRTVSATWWQKKLFHSLRPN